MDHSATIEVADIAWAADRQKPCRASLGLDGRGARPHTIKTKAASFSLTA